MGWEGQGGRGRRGGVGEVGIGGVGVMGDCSELFAKELKSGTANIKEEGLCSVV